MKRETGFMIQQMQQQYEVSSNFVCWSKANEQSTMFAQLRSCLFRKVTGKY